MDSTLPADLDALATRHCRPLVERLDDADSGRLAALLPGWSIEGSVLHKTFSFDDHYETLAFANAVGWIAHRQDHHPDYLVGFSRCRLAWSTHSAGGLTLNDFVCAARVEKLFA